VSYLLITLQMQCTYETSLRVLMLYLLEPVASEMLQD